MYISINIRSIKYYYNAAANVRRYDRVIRVIWVLIYADKYDVRMVKLKSETKINFL